MQYFTSCGSVLFVYESLQHKLMLVNNGKFVIFLILTAFQMERGNSMNLSTGDKDPKAKKVLKTLRMGE